MDLGFLKRIDTDASRGKWLTALEVGIGRSIQANQVGEIRTGNPIFGVSTSSEGATDEQAPNPDQSAP